MAKQTKSQSQSQTTPATTNAAAAPAAPAGFPTKTNGDNDVFTRLLGPDGKPSVQAVNAKKLAPQEQLIVNTIEAAPDGKLTRAELVAKLTGVIVTRQPVGRIVIYYQKGLGEKGLVSLTKAAAVAGQ